MQNNIPTLYTLKLDSFVVKSAKISTILCLFVQNIKNVDRIATEYHTEGSLDVFAYDFSVTALTPRKCTKERPSPFRKISNWRRCLGAKDRGTCLKKRFVHGITSFLKKT